MSDDVMAIASVYNEAATSNIEKISKTVIFLKEEALDTKSILPTASLLDTG